MKKLAVGILAHVDAGKTTLSEGLLFRSGCLKKLGRVDHQDAFLDTEWLERERGITIFSKQAVLPIQDGEVTLLDTPGHVDFSGEMERTLQVLDYAILVISGSDGIQGHTRTLWQLLARYQIPTFLFVNKMDLLGSDQAALLTELQQRLDGNCVDFTQQGDAFWEAVAVCGEQALTEYLEQGRIQDVQIAALMQQRKLFPCYFGSALKLDGVDALLDGLARYTQAPAYPEVFGARIFKIARDAQGNRLTYLKVTGGSLRVKELLTNRQEGLGAEKIWEEKADQLRIYSGAKYRLVELAEAGTICAVTGLSHSRVGEGLGYEAAGVPPVLEPVLTYQVLLPEGCNPLFALPKLMQLAEEEPQLRIVWNEQLQEIHLQLMGEVQMEILHQLILTRFGLEVSFGPGNIVYRETICAPVEGVGHFEPLRHYAEVHLLLEPAPRGSGLQFATACSEDQLERNWQRLILTHLEEREHPGVLLGASITDMKITLVAGRAHKKHTEGGDFRQATYRAVRQGLMCAQSLLLEPYYQFRLELPTELVGRAMSDLQRMCGSFEPPQTDAGEAVLVGSAPVVELRDYAIEVAAYTRGRGKLSCTFKGYEPCHNPEEVLAASDYDCLRDVENPADSVFCAHGAGVVVPWDQVRAHMHIDSGLRFGKTAQPPPQEPAEKISRSSYCGTLEQDKELQAIFERTYGPVKQNAFFPQRHPEQQPATATPWDTPPQDLGPEYLLVDGYNIIFAWEELKAVAQENLDAARQLLVNLLSNYQGYRQCEVILVFDAYKVRGNPGTVTRAHNIYVVYTKEAETADAYIEKATYEIGKKHRVRVATSDSAEQLIILGHGALRISANTFRAELEQVNGQIAALLERNRRQQKSLNVKAALDKARRPPR